MKKVLAFLTTRMVVFGTASGILAGIASAILGSWNLALETLAIIMVLDYATGLIVAGVFHASPKSTGGALESKAAFKGLVRKVGIIVIVIAFHQLDRLTGKTFFRDGAAWAFFIEEFISVIENLGLMGLPMPKFILKSVEWLRNKSEALADAIPTGKDEDETADGCLLSSALGEGEGYFDDAEETSKKEKPPDGEETDASIPRDGRPVPYGAQKGRNSNGPAGLGMTTEENVKEEADNG